MSLRQIQFVKQFATLLGSVPWGGAVYSSIIKNRTVPLLEFVDGEKQLTAEIQSFETCIYRITEHLFQKLDENIITQQPWAKESPHVMLHSLILYTYQLESSLLQHSFPLSSQRALYAIVLKKASPPTRLFWESCFGSIEKKATMSFALLWIKLKQTLPKSTPVTTVELWKRIVFRFLTNSPQDISEESMNGYPISITSFIQFFDLFGSIHAWYEQCENIVLARKEFLWSYGVQRSKPSRILSNSDTGTYLFCFSDTTIASILLYVTVQCTVQKIPIVVLNNHKTLQPVFLCAGESFDSFDEVVEYFKMYLVSPYDLFSYCPWYWEGTMKQSEVFSLFDAEAKEGQFCVTTLKTGKDADCFALFHRCNGKTYEKHITLRNNEFFIDALGLRGNSLSQLVWEGQKKGFWGELFTTSELYNEPHPPKFNARGAINVAEVSLDGEVTLRGGVVSRRHKKISYSLEDVVPPQQPPYDLKRKSTESLSNPLSKKASDVDIKFTNFLSVPRGVPTPPTYKGKSVEKQVPVLQVKSPRRTDSKTCTYFGQVPLSVSTGGVYVGTVELPSGALQKSLRHSIQLTCEGTYLHLFVKNSDIENDNFIVQGVAACDNRFPLCGDVVVVHYTVFCENNY